MLVGSEIDRMRALKIVLLGLGVCLLVVLLYRIGATPILTTLRRLTWWQFVLICLPFAAVSAVDTLGWRFAFATDRAPFGRLLGARLAGEALNIVTAVGAVGGEAAKVWLVRRDVTYEESVPAVIIAKTTITMAQAVFMLIGLVVAWLTGPVTSEVLRGMLWLLAIEVVAVGGFLAVQVSGTVARAGRLLKLAGLIADTAHAETLDRTLRDYYRTRWRRLGLSLGFHLVGWLLGALEAVVVLWALDVNASVATATVIEALGSGVRFATFVVPASLGPFEAANAAVFSALGYGAGAGLAFSLVRRARQAVWVAIGIVVLLLMRWWNAASSPDVVAKASRSR
jgi:glycosyltransferase 2 family protein